MAISAITSYNATTKSKLGNNTGKTNLYATNQSPSFGSAPVTLTSARKGIVATAAALLTAATIALTGCGSSPASAGEDQFESSSSTEEITPQDSLSSSVESSSSSVDTAVSSSSKNVESSSSKEVNSSSSNVASSSSEVKSSSSAQSSSSVASSSNIEQSPIQQKVVEYRDFLMAKTKSSAVAAKAAVTAFDIQQFNMTDSSAKVNEEYVRDVNNSTDSSLAVTKKRTNFITGASYTANGAFTLTENDLLYTDDDGLEFLFQKDEANGRLIKSIIEDGAVSYKLGIYQATAENPTAFRVENLSSGISGYLTNVAFYPSN